MPPRKTAKKKTAKKATRKKYARKPRQQTEEQRRPNHVALARMNGLMKMVAVLAVDDSDGGQLARVLSTDPHTIDPKNFISCINDVFQENPYLAKLSVTERDRKKALYLKKFAETGHNGLSCKTAGVDPDTFYAWKRDDPEFAKNFEIAKEISVSRLEDAAISRAANGVVQPVYQGGKLVGYERKYSDALLGLLLKGQAPDRYRDPMRGDAAPSKPSGGRGLTKEQAAELRAKVLGIPEKKKGLKQ